MPMEQTIQELTEKIYREGVEKGEARANAIIAEAQEKAAAMASEAKARSEKTIAEARQQALEMKRNAEAEIRLAATQALSTIKQQILNLISARTIDGSLTAALSDPATMKEFVAIILNNWKPGTDAPRLDVLLPARKQDELQKAFQKDASDLMKKGLILSFSKSMKAGFRIGPQDGGYKISLTDEDFAEFIKEFLRPQTRAFLFGE
jgi:V/A-type H+/Na+-transporting ATPase subunit E